MNSIQTPIAIRTTAAALAVFMTVATLNTLFVDAGPYGVVMAQTAARAAARAASAPLLVQLLAQAPIGEIEIGH